METFITVSEDSKIEVRGGSSVDDAWVWDYSIFVSGNGGYLDVGGFTPEQFKKLAVDAVNQLIQDGHRFEMLTDDNGNQRIFPVMKQD